MTDPVISAAEQAAIPSALAIVAALDTFVANIEGDPAQVPAKVPGALQILLGSVELQAPVLATAEFGAATSAARSVFASWTAKLKAAQTTT